MNLSSTQQFLNPKFPLRGTKWSGAVWAYSSIEHSPTGKSRIHAPNAADVHAPSLFAALQEQLGLKLEARKGPVQVLVVDHVEKTPTEN
jgi:uncharacterized protein (TIGR03435 family)